MPGKPPPETPDPTPAAGSYQLPDDSRHSKYSASPLYSFTAGSRFPLPGAPGKDKPGPGAYQADDQKFKYRAEVKVGFGTAAARGRPNPVRQCGPGPGAYKVSSGPDLARAAFMQGKWPRTGIRSRSEPGPGAYDASDDLTRPAAVKVGFGSSSREDWVSKHQRQMPGPGSYEPHKLETVGSDALMFSLASRRRCNDLSSYLSPGPGAYNSQVSSFGY